MDSLITAAARALATGDPLAALQRVSLRDDPPALALRGIAMAQLGDFVRARTLIRRARRAFVSGEVVARARCIVAEAEIALASRDLAWPTHALDAARTTLEAHGDRVNAAHAGYLQVRRLVLIGRIDDAERRLAGLEPTGLPAATRAAHELVVAGLAVRRLRIGSASAALDRAAQAAHEARIPALIEEVKSAARMLKAPAARLIMNGSGRTLVLAEIETLLTSEALVVDACRLVVRQGRTVIPFRRRPVLFALVRALAEAWPEDATRDVLVARAFAAREADESHRARLRVEVGRLRRTLRALASVRATKDGFALVPLRSRPLAVLATPVEEEHAAALAFLADGESWSSSALAIALGTSQRTAQRALDSLAAAGKVQWFGRGRARRWVTPPLPGIATTLLLPAPLPID